MALRAERASFPHHAVKARRAELRESLLLNAGAYQISLYDGLSGIEKLSVRPEGQRVAKSVPAKAGCMMMKRGYWPGATPWSPVAGQPGSARLVLQPLPLSLDAPVHLAIDPGRTLSLPVARRPACRRARRRASPFECNGQLVPGQCPIGPGRCS